MYFSLSSFIFYPFPSYCHHISLTRQYSPPMSRNQNITPLPSPTNTRPNSPFSNLQRSFHYYLPGGDLYIQVSNTLFRVHSYFLIRESVIWQHFLRHNTRGRLQRHPIMLVDELPTPTITSSDTFTAFLWIFYNPLYSIYRAPPTFWFDILSFAVMWGMENVCDLAYRELDRIVDHHLTTSTRWLTMHADEDLD